MKSKTLTIKNKKTRKINFCTLFLGSARFDRRRASRNGRRDDANAERLRDCLPQIRRHDCHTGEFLPKWSEKHKWLNLPVLRGGATLIQSMALGVKALNFSAQVAHDDMEAQEQKKKSQNLETQAVLAEGTTNENFTKAPAKVIMPEKRRKRKNRRRRRARSVR